MHKRQANAQMLLQGRTHLELTSWPPCDDLQKPSEKLLEIITGCYQDTGRGPGSAACPTMVGKNGQTLGFESRQTLLSVAKHC